MTAETIVLDEGQYARSAIEIAGGIYLGVQKSLAASERLHLFQDPATRTTSEGKKIGAHETGKQAS